MRKKSQWLLFMLTVLAFLAIHPAQAQETMRISMSDGTAMDIAIADIQKLTFDIAVGMQKHPGLVKQLLRLKVYPNPAKEQATIDYTLQGEGRVFIEILNLQGLQLDKTDLGAQPPGDYRRTVNTLRLPSGTYICLVRQNHVLVSEKIIVKH